MMRHNSPLRFFEYKRKGNVLGGVCVDQGWLANDIKNKNRSLQSLPIPATSIYLPFDMNSSGKPIIPFKSKCLHPLQKDLFVNTAYNLFSKRNIGLVKSFPSGFSKKTISTREREIRKFLAVGGAFVPISDLDSNYFFDIYRELFFARRKREIIEQDLNRIFFNEFHHCFKGDVIFLNNEPIAIQLLLSVSSQAGYFVDFINIGYTQESPLNSLGTILMWRNLTSLTAEAAEKNQNLFYSYGFMSGEYKTRWCNSLSVGRAIC
jgi:hypothetical protein